MMKTEMHTGRIRCHSGVFYDYQNPNPDMIRLDDIAHHLSNTCRFSGACEPYYSVAEHSVLVSRLALDGYKREALLHDAAEAYLWDIPRPAKHLYGDVYAELTTKCDIVIGLHLGIDPDGFHSTPVKAADGIALNYEGNVLMPDWEATEPNIPYGVLSWQLGLRPALAKKLFLRECAYHGISPKPDYAPPLQLSF